MDPSIQSTQILRDIVTRYGPPTELNVSMYKGLMHDLLADYTREFNLLKIPLEQGLVFRLIKESQSVPFEILLQQMVTYLHTNFGLDKNAAQWTIETWAEALEIHQITTNITDFSADFISEITSGIVPLKIYFTPKYSNPQAIYHWIFGDGKESYEQNPCHEYTEAGTFSVSLQISQDGRIEEKRVDNLIEVKPDIQPGKKETVKNQIIIKTVESDNVFKVPVEEQSSDEPGDKKKKWTRIGIVSIFLICIIGILGFSFSNMMQGEEVQKIIHSEITTTPTLNIDQLQTNNYATDSELIHANLVKIVPLFTAWKMDVKSVGHANRSLEEKALITEIIEQQKYYDLSDRSKNPRGKKVLHPYYYAQFLRILYNIVTTTTGYSSIKINLPRARSKLQEMFDSCSEYEGKCGAHDPIFHQFWE